MFRAVPFLVADFILVVRLVVYFHDLIPDFGRRFLVDQVRHCVRQGFRLVDKLLPDNVRQRDIGADDGSRAQYGGHDENHDKRFCFQRYFHFDRSLPVIETGPSSVFSGRPIISQFIYNIQTNKEYFTI